MEFKSFKLMFEDKGASIDMEPLTLSGPQKMKPDLITGETGIAKVPHYSFSLPAGYTCPYAKECRSRTVFTGKRYAGGEGAGKVQDGPLCKFRCFAVSGEGQYKAVRAARFNNFSKLTGIDLDAQFPTDEVRDKYGLNKGEEVDQLDAVFKGGEEEIGDNLEGISHHIHDTAKIAALITSTIEINKSKIMKTGPKFKGGGVLRVHVSGDFYSQSYFDAWMITASNFPDITFYSYTKSIPYWIKAKAAGTIPSNYKLIASYGGTKDHLIDENGFKYAKVCFSKEEAANYPVKYVDENGSWVHTTGLAICDEDDFPAYGNDIPFALLLHGTQPSGSEAASAISKINKSARQELLATRVNFLVNTQGMTPVNAHIEVALRVYAFNNKRDDAKLKSYESGRGRTPVKPYDAAKRKKELISQIAKYLYRDEKGLDLDGSDKPKNMAEYTVKAHDIFDERIGKVMMWLHNVEDVDEITGDTPEIETDIDTTPVKVPKKTPIKSNQFGKVVPTTETE